MRVELLSLGLFLFGAMLCSGSYAAAQAPPTSPAAQAAAETHFEQQVAPLLRTRCLECHDSKDQEGELNLATRVSALAGGASGKAILPGNSKESLLWQQIESDDMPQDREPLTGAEKQLIRNWIDQGAIWSLASIAPKARPEKLVNWLQRLTVDEYIETVRVAVGVDISEEARQLLPPDLRADGFSNTAYNLNVDLSHVEAYARLAQLIVERMDVDKFASRFENDGGKSKLRTVVTGMGKWLLRGPLNEQEIEGYLSIGREVQAEGGNETEAVGFMAEAMLQSPRFIYRIEQQTGDGTPQPVDDYELASRLSYILWGAPPDEALLAAADAGKLSNREQVRQQVERMLQDPRAVDRSSQFLAEWLNLDRLDHLRPNSKLYPDWNPQLADDMRAETLAFFREVAWEQDRPLSDLLNAQVTHVTPRLAAHYNLPLGDGNLDLAAVKQRHEGLEALYTFSKGNGNVVHDRSGRSDPLNLTIDKESAVEWTDQGLKVTGSTRIAHDDAPRQLIDSLKKSQAITIEAWITPRDTKQEGPARIVSLSSGTSKRNFTLGQEADKYDVRFRTNKNDNNGMPSLSSKGNAVKTELTHVVYTRDSSGNAKLYLDGKEHSARKVEGNLSNWDNSYRLGIANETTGDRAWLGMFRQVAIYSRALNSEEVKAHATGGAWLPSARLARIELADVPSRGGLLTQGSVLTIGGDNASMVTRGLFVLHDLLHGEVKDPPPCVDTTPVPTKPGVSQRKIAEARLANRACGGCHVAFEPLAFGLEQFDGLGTFRPVDRHGNKLRNDGEILFPGTKKSVSYQNSAELMDLLAGSDRVRQSIARKVTQFALGRPLVEADAETLHKINETARAEGGSYADLITAIVTSDLVLMTRTEIPESETTSTGDKSK